MTIEDLLSAPSDSTYEPLERVPSAYNPLHSYRLPRGEEKHYQQQYGDMYFLRLAKLKPVVEKIAKEAWDDFTIGGETVQRVERVLDVRQGQLCWVAGTVYMDMPLKPNILDDISRDVRSPPMLLHHYADLAFRNKNWLSAVPARPKYFSSDGSATQTMLEDESGRLRLTGPMLANSVLVTGCIVAVLGTENANGDFEVIEVRVPDLPRQPQRWERDDITKTKPKPWTNRPKGNKIAIVSGLGISSTSSYLPLSLLSEYLLGEAGTQAQDQSEASRISRLIIAGNSLASTVIPIAAADTSANGGSKKVNSTHHKKYGYDASAYNAAPTAQLDSFLADLLPSIPVTIMPGDSDPANTSLPQQAVHAAMFPHARAYTTHPSGEEGGETNWFDSVTNPWEGDVEGWRWIGNSGQPIDDILRYLDTEDRLEVIENCLRWRLGAPTAPDTLWCYPFQDRDQFVMTECPHLFFVGNQPRYETTTIEGYAGQTVRLISIPRFSDRGEVVLVDSETLEVEVLRFEVWQEQSEDGGEQT